MKQETAKDLPVIESSSHQNISHAKLLGVLVFHVDLNMLRLGQTWTFDNLI